MGLRFRKNFNFGGFRVNFSKSGVGYSYGVPGFRYTVTADGRERVTVSIPGTGISWVEESNSRKRENDELERAVATGNYNTIQNASVDKLVSVEYKDFIAECNLYMKNWNWFTNMRKASFIVTIFLAVAAIVMDFHIIWAILGIITGAYAYYCHSSVNELKKNKIKMNYEFEVEPNPYTELVELMEGTRKSQMIQAASSAITNAIKRQHAGASNIYDLNRVTIRKQQPIFLQTNVNCYSIDIGNQTLFILPDKMLILSDVVKIGAVSIDSIEMKFDTTNFRETGNVANDATIVGRTYQYVNNNGTPDRRYKDNREIPICLYGELTVGSKEGINMKFFCSNANCTQAFYDKFEEIKNRRKKPNNYVEKEKQNVNKNNLHQTVDKLVNKVVCNNSTIKEHIAGEVSLDKSIQGIEPGTIIYDGDDDNVRYVLGVAGNDPLICFGINPSTANDIEDDPTISRIKKIVKENKKDGWVMLNLYPQRATNPDDMHKEPNKELLLRNTEVVRSVFNAYPNALILASWGDAIEKRGYLRDSLETIISIDYDRQWVCRGELTAKGNPRHQLYVANNTPLKDLIFDADANILGCYDRD